MRVVYMGTPHASVPSLRAVAEAFEVPAVYTQPDRPRGRGRETLPSPVKEAALELGLRVVEPASMRDPRSQDELRSLAPDVVAVVAFGQILPREVLEAPRLGCVNVHFSLLPRWRGAAPVERAIMAGDTETGITTMLMDEGLDTGPILATHVEPISAEDTSGALLERLAARGAEMLVDSVRRLAAGELEPRPQPEDGVTYARKITAEDTELDLTGGSTSLRDVVRALNPHPGAFTWFRGRRLKVLRAEVVEGTGPAGEIVSVQDGGPQVQTGSGRLELVEVQPEGKRPMSGADFVRGYKPQVGERLGVPR